VATKKKDAPAWEPIVVPVRVDENFRPIYAGGTPKTAAPVAATTKPATGTKED